MTEDLQTQWIRLVLFMLALFLIALSGSYISYLIFVLMYLVTWAFVSWEGGESISELGLKIDNRFSPHLIIGALAAALATTLIAAIAFFFGGQLRPLNEITGYLVLNVVINAALFSFFEELTHRGYLLTRMERLGGRGPAIVFSSIFFALIHFDWWGPAGFNIFLISLFTFNLFLGGVVLSLSYYWSGRRLWVPIAFHFMWNVVAYTIFPEFPNQPVIHPEIFQIEWGVTTIIGFLFSLIVLWGLLASEKNK